MFIDLNITVLLKSTGYHGVVKVYWIVTRIGGIWVSGFNLMTLLKELNTSLSLLHN